MKARRVTSQDVADRAGVSRTTVSLVLNEVQGIQISEETRRRVLEAAQFLDYVPEAAAQALASRRVGIIGLILTRSPRHIASDTFLTQILDGLVEVVHEQGMRLLIDILETHHQKETYLHLIRSKRIDGLILSGPRFDDAALKSLEADGFPTVLMGSLPESGFYSVDVDNFNAAREAVDHLIRLGHKRIACITNAPTSYTAAAERLRGYRRALEAAGLPYDHLLVRQGDFEPESGYQQMMKLLQTEYVQKEPFTAAFVASDVVAFGAKAAIREFNLKIPDDIALVGFDDVPFARYSDPPLTTVRLPAHDLGRTAGNQLIRIVMGEKFDTPRILLDTELIIRESCGARRQ